MLWLLDKLQGIRKRNDMIGEMMSIIHGAFALSCVVGTFYGVRFFFYRTESAFIRIIGTALGALGAVYVFCLVLYDLTDEIEKQEEEIKKREDDCRVVVWEYLEYKDTHEHDLGNLEYPYGKPPRFPPIQYDRSRINEIKEEIRQKMYKE